MISSTTKRLIITAVPTDEVWTTYVPSMQRREVFQKWTLRAQSGPQGQAEASALGRFTWDGVEDGIAILVLGQVDRQNLGQGGDEVVDLADVIDAADADCSGADIGQHHRFVQVAVDQR